jgi:hypothetical protein
MGSVDRDPSGQGEGNSVNPSAESDRDDTNVKVG